MRNSTCCPFVGFGLSISPSNLPVVEVSGLDTFALCRLNSKSGKGWALILDTSPHKESPGATWVWESIFLIFFGCESACNGWAIPSAPLAPFLCRNSERIQEGCLGARKERIKATYYIHGRWCLKAKPFRDYLVFSAEGTCVSWCDERCGCLMRGRPMDGTEDGNPEWARDQLFTEDSLARRVQTPPPPADDSVGPVGMQNLITKNPGVEVLCLS